MRVDVGADLALHGLDVDPVDEVGGDVLDVVEVVVVVEQRVEVAFGAVEAVRRMG